MTSVVLKNGSIYTADENLSWAQALVIANGRIAYVGPDAGLEAYHLSDSAVIDLEGKMVLPGFCDAHAHPSQAMDYVSNVNLYMLGSVDEYGQAVDDYARNHPEKEIVRGGGWDNRLFSSIGPRKEILDDLVPDKPAAMLSYDGHSLWVNSVTLERAGMTKDTDDPYGGIIERDPDTGEPAGTLRETAMQLVDGVIPDYSLDERKHALLAYQEMAVRAGVTLCHDAMLDAPSIATFKELEAEGKLKILFRGSYLMKADQEAGVQIEALHQERTGNDASYFRVSGAKLFVDGVVEGGTAYLHEPYVHKPGYRGEPIWRPEMLNNITALLDGKEIQIHYHVIGDAAATITLDALDYARNLNGKRDSRHLVTHLQLVAPSDVKRFAELDVVGVPQPFWFKVDDYYRKLALPFLGKARADIQYPMRSFLDQGVIMASASDFPVTIPFDPLVGIQTGIMRSEIGSTTAEVLWPEECVSLENMIASFTKNGAFANFLEHETGSLEVGKRADCVILDRNLFNIPPSEISSTSVLMTVVGGRAVFADDVFKPFVW